MADTLEKWVDGLQSSGRYTFSRADALAAGDRSPEAVKKALQRLVRRGRIAKVKDYFFVIVPIEYALAGGPPASWFIDELMTAMTLPYYVGLLSAAGLHGASHQQPQVFQVVVDRSVRPIVVGRARIQFFASKFVGQAAAFWIKTPTGSMRASTPETTVIDLVRFARSSGALDNVATVIAELVPLLNPRKLLAAAQVTGDVPSAQRLGFLLDQLHARRLSSPIHVWVQAHSPRPVPLRPGRSIEGASQDRRWHVLVNQPIEVEA